MIFSPTPFETQARTDFEKKATDILAESIMYDQVKPLVAKLSQLHRAEVRRAEKAVLDKVEKKVIGPAVDHAQYCDLNYEKWQNPEDVHFSCEAVFQNEQREAQLNRLAALRKEKP